MINFIVCDDHKYIRESVEKVIDQVMMKNSNAYKKHMFEDYNEDFNKIISSKLASKIYVLDIETKTSSGVLVADKIRENDIDSIIIFLTSHEEKAYDIIKSQLMCLTFISKKDSYIELLGSAINKAISMVGKKQAIRFRHQGVLYTLPVSDILYITRDSVERKSIIVTDYGTFMNPTGLNQLAVVLKDTFIQTHRACFINRNRYRQINMREKKIIFDNGEETNLLSDSYKKEVNKECCKS